MTIFFQNKEQYDTSLDMAKFVDFDDENSGRPSYITSYVINQIKQISRYETIKVTNELVEAPDYISYKKYQGSHAFWWIIMIYNNLLEFSEIKYGMELKIPSITDVNNILSSIQIAETSVKNGNYEKVTMVK